MKTKLILMTMTALTVLLMSACGGAAPAEPAAQAPVESQPVVEQPAQNQEVVPAQSFAPACQTTTNTSCAAPALTDTLPNNTYCVQKVPYQNILAPAGSVFEPIPNEGDPEFHPLICDDSGTDVDGLRVFSCRGAELWTYDLRITPAGCGAALQTGTGQCAEGQGYDAAQNCCAPVTGSSGGTVNIKVNMGGCPIK